MEIIKDIHNRNKVAIIVGGTNYYLESLLFDFEVGKDEKYSGEEENEKEIVIGEEEMKKNWDEL
jgi:tRNA dimethylallyltransferase